MKVRTLSGVCVVLCWALLSVPARAQKPLFWVAQNWYEVGVTYPKSAPIGQITLGCAMDRYENSVDWGDGTSDVLSTPGASYQITYHGETKTVIGPGTFNLYASADKTFAPEAAADPHTARILSTLHCLDGSEEHWLTTSTLHVKARTALKTMELAVSPGKSAGTTLEIKGGSAFRVIIQALDRASLARIHVDLDWTDPDKVLVSQPTSVEVPFDMFNVEFVVQTAKTTRKRSVVLKASTSGTPLPATINVVP